MAQKISGLLNYNCIKCSDPVNLEVRYGMTENTISLWENLFDTKLCLSCYCDKSIILRETADKILCLH